MLFGEQKGNLNSKLIVICSINLLFPNITNLFVAFKAVVSLAPPYQLKQYL